MKKILVLLLVSFLFLPSVNSQKAVIGVVDYAYKMKGEGAEQMAGMMPTKMVITYGKNGLSMEMKGGMMAAAMGKTVVNGNTGESFMIKEAEKTVYVMSAEEIEKAAEAVVDPQIEEFSDTKTILGYTCKKYTQTIKAQGTSMKQTLWVTKDLAAPKYEGDAFKGMAGQGGLSFDIEGFPMLVEVELPGMPMTLELEVTNIEFKKVNDKEFEKPKGYTEKPFSEMNPF